LPLATFGVDVQPTIRKRALNAVQRRHSSEVSPPIAS
jgi:hypothetical protein